MDIALYKYCQVLGYANVMTGLIKGRAESSATPMKGVVFTELYFLLSSTIVNQPCSYTTL